MNEATAPANPRSHRGDKPSPPPLRAAVSASWIPVGAFLGVLAVSRLARQGRLPFPPCWLRKFTGIPCPTCGCTRSLLAWAQLDPAQAFFFNPLFFLVCAGALLWPVLATFEKASGCRWFSQAWARVPHRRAWQLAAVLAALNWLYLWLRLPK